MCLGRNKRSFGLSFQRWFRLFLDNVFVRFINILLQCYTALFINITFYELLASFRFTKVLFCQRQYHDVRFHFQSMFFTSKLYSKRKLNKNRKDKLNSLYIKKCYTFPFQQHCAETIRLVNNLFICRRRTSGLQSSCLTSAANQAENRNLLLTFEFLCFSSSTSVLKWSASHKEFTFRVQPLFSRRAKDDSRHFKVA